MKTHTMQDNYNGKLQLPFISPFKPTTTAAQIIQGIDLHGKTAIVTGGYSGIGLETARVLVSAGARVWIPVRDAFKAEKNLNMTDITIKPMDLMDPISIDNFAEQFLATGKPLDMLINNAGIMWAPLRRDLRGFESHLSTNHIGHFHLTARLWPALKKTSGARIVNVSCYGHQLSSFNFEDPNFEHRPYETLEAYAQSKTANNLFTVELDHRARQFGVRSFSLHPGAIYGTDLMRDAPISLFKLWGTYDANGNMYPHIVKKLKTIPQGASTTVWCATHPSLNDIGGVYCEDNNIAEIDHGNIDHQYTEPKSLRGVQPYSIDEKRARACWTLTEKMIGFDFPVD